MEDFRGVVLSFLSVPDDREEILGWKRIIKQYNVINATHYTLDDLDLGISNRTAFFRHRNK